eukprot:8923199-Alexandrium_andersonii.AAC.1
MACPFPVPHGTDTTASLASRGNGTMAWVFVGSPARTGVSVLLPVGESPLKLGDCAQALVLGIRRGLPVVARAFLSAATHWSWTNEVGRGGVSGFPGRLRWGPCW